MSITPSQMHEKNSRPGYPVHTTLSDGYADFIVKGLSNQSDNTMITVAIAKSDHAPNERVYIGISGTHLTQTPFLETLKGVIDGLNEKEASSHPDGIKREVILSFEEGQDSAENNVRLFRTRDTDTENAQHELAKAHAQMQGLSSDAEKQQVIDKILEQRTIDRAESKKKIVALIETLSEENQKINQGAIASFNRNKTRLTEISKNIELITSETEDAATVYKAINKNLPKNADKLIPELSSKFESLTKNLQIKEVFPNKVDALSTAIQSYIKQFGIGKQIDLIRSGNIVYTKDHILNGLSEKEIFIDHAERACSEVRAIIRSAQDKYTPTAFSTFWVGDKAPYPADGTNRPSGIKFSEPCDVCALNQKYLLALGRALAKTSTDTLKIPKERMPSLLTPETINAVNADIMKQILEEKGKLGPGKTKYTIFSRPYSNSSNTPGSSREPVTPGVESKNQGPLPPVSENPITPPLSPVTPNSISITKQGQSADTYFLTPLTPPETPGPTENPLSSGMPETLNTVSPDQPLTIEIPMLGHGIEPHLGPNLLMVAERNNEDMHEINWDDILRVEDDHRPFRADNYGLEVAAEDGRRILDAGLDDLLSSEPLLRGGAREPTTPGPRTTYEHPLANFGTGFNAGMTLLGIGGVYSSIRKGDTTHAVLGAGQTAIGAIGLSTEVGVRTGLLKMSTAVRSVTKAVPFVGTAFVAYSAIEDGQAIYKSAKAGDTLGVVKGSLDMGLDIAIGVSGLIPGIGTAASIGLVATRMFMDSLIDQAADPYAYRKSFAVLDDPHSWWLEKGIAATTGAVQYSFEKVGDFFIPWRIEDFGRKQRIILDKLEAPKDNQGEFFQTSEEEGISVLDFNSPALAHHAGALTVDMTSKNKANIGFKSAVVENADYQLTTSLNFNTKNAPTLQVIMGHGATYSYKMGTTITIKGGISTVDTVVLQNESLRSTYKAPQDGTNVIFVAPSTLKFGDPGFPDMERTQPLGREEIHYKITGGTGQNVYVLGYEQTEVICGTGMNVIHLPFDSPKDHNIKLTGLRDDGTCLLNLEHISNTDFINSAVFVWDLQKSKLFLQHGKVSIEIPRILEKLTIKTTENGEIFVFNIKKFVDEDLLIDHLKNYAESAIIDLRPRQTKNVPLAEKIVQGSDACETFIVDAKAEGPVKIRGFDATQDTLRIMNVSKALISKILNKQFTCKIIDTTAWRSADQDSKFLNLSSDLRFALSYNYNDYKKMFAQKPIKIDMGAGVLEFSLWYRKNLKLWPTSMEADVLAESAVFTPRTVTCTSAKKDNILLKSSDSGTLILKDFDPKQDILTLSGFTADHLEKFTATVKKGVVQSFSFGNTDVKFDKTPAFLTLKTDFGLYTLGTQKRTLRGGTYHIGKLAASSIQYDQADNSSSKGTDGADLFVFPKAGFLKKVDNFDFDHDRIKLSNMPQNWWERAYLSTYEGNLILETWDANGKVYGIHLKSNSLKILTVQTDDGVFKVDAEACLKRTKELGSSPLTPLPIKDYIVFSTQGTQSVLSTQTDPETMNATPGNDVFMVNAEQARTTFLTKFDFTKDQIKIVKISDLALRDAQIAFNGQTSTLKLMCGKAVVILDVPNGAKILHISTGDTLLEVNIQALRTSSMHEALALKDHTLSAMHGLINHVGDQAFHGEFGGTRGSDSFLINPKHTETVRISDFDFKADKLLVAHLKHTWFDEVGSGISYDIAKKAVLLTFGGKAKVEISVSDERLQNPLIVDSEEGAFSLNIPKLIGDAKAGTPQGLKAYISGSLTRSQFFKSPENSKIENFKGTPGGDEFILNAQHAKAKIADFDGKVDHIQMLNLDATWWMHAQGLKDSLGLKLKFPKVSGVSEVSIESQTIGDIFVLKANDGVFEIDTTKLTEAYQSLTIKAATMGYKNFMFVEGSSKVANDQFSGTSGVDTFIINPKHAGKTIIKEFEAGKDKLYVMKPSAEESAWRYNGLMEKAKDVGTDLYLHFDDQNEVKIENFQKAQFTKNTLQYHDTYQDLLSMAEHVEDHSLHTADDPFAVI
jgi:hypothetical protein